MRDVTYYRGNTEPGSWLTDPRDFYVEEVEVDAAGRIALRSSLYGAADLMAESLDYIARGTGGIWKPG